MSTNLENIANKIFAPTLAEIEAIDKRYPKRQLEPGAIVSRIAPSPTGFVHLGTLYTALISEHFAHQTNGVFILRIEDTDKKREVAGTAQLFASTLDNYELHIDEGLMPDSTEKGGYGPYHQSARADIYQAYAKKLFLEGKAYACFASSEELENMREKQAQMGHRSGYWGDFAIWRHKSLEEVEEALDKGLKPVIRFKSAGNFNNKIAIKDILLGSRELPENDQDIVIIKTDGLPTYHFAHAIDDHLMGTTHVIRGNEWFPSLPLHLQLFEALAWPAPQYAHLSPIQKMDEGKKRKLSKRHDPESNLEYFAEAGYPQEALIEYLLNLANSNFEDWRKANPNLSYKEFELSWKKLAKSNGPLFDTKKLEDISKEIISKFTADTIYQRALSWSKQYSLSLKKILEDNKDYAIKIINIEREGAIKPRKDLSKWSELESEISYFYDELFSIDKQSLEEVIKQLNGTDIKSIINDFIANYNEQDNQEIWFEKLKTIGQKYGFAPSMKDYKNDENKYKGQLGTIAQLLRLLLTGRKQSPNLAEVMRVLGDKRMRERLSNCL